MVRAKREIEPKDPKQPKREEPRFCRNTINLHVGRIRRLFRWAAENGYVEPSVHHSLLTVQGLQRGRTDAPESEPVRPVLDAHVDAKLRRVCRQVAAMIGLQLLTGMRPGEVVTMRVADLDMKADSWIYRPASHKTEHHGRAREIVLGPKAQEIVRPFLKTDFGAFLFSPKDAADERRAVARENRATPMTPSQRARRPKSNPKKAPGDRYTTTSYARAITVACEKRDEPKGKSKLPARPEIPHWHPNQLRHAAATKLRALYGIETARVVLGQHRARRAGRTQRACPTHGRTRGALRDHGAIRTDPKDTRRSAATCRQMRTRFVDTTTLRESAASDGRGTDELEHQRAESA
jgi:integrase